MNAIHYHAAHAPDVPDWFDIPYEPRPKFPEAEDYIHADVNPNAEEDRKMLRSWVLDGCYDLPDHLMPFQRAVQAHHEAAERQAVAHSLRRITEWRAVYAKAMVERLEGSGVPS